MELELPFLLYDTSIRITELTENKQYRNIGDMLVARCPSVISVLRFCGTEERILTGNGSDYERFYALCASMQYLADNPVSQGVKRLLADVFNVYEDLSVYCVDELWMSLNALIDDAEMKPTSLFRSMNVESIVCKADPFSKEYVKSEDIDIYTSIDLNDTSSFISSSNNNCSDLDSFIRALYTVESQKSIKVKFDNTYEYARNSKRLELEGFYQEIRSGRHIDQGDLNSLITYIAVNAAQHCNENEITIIIEPECSSKEIDLLFSYLKYNKVAPSSTLLCSSSPEAYRDFLLHHTERNCFGMPSVIPICNDIQKLSKQFPIGHCMQYQGYITDAVSAAYTMNERNMITELFGEDISENMTYANIKNRFMK